MAQAVAFDEANAILGPPPGEDENVTPLPVLRRDGRLVSCWRPSAAELAEILRTGKIWLSVWGERTQPPVWVTGLKGEVI